MLLDEGVGKNVLADRLLELVRHEREYIQLHRDTTVQSLTLSPSIRNGVVVWEVPLDRSIAFSLYDVDMFVGLTAHPSGHSWSRACGR